MEENMHTTVSHGLQILSDQPMNHVYSGADLAKAKATSKKRTAPSSPGNSEKLQKLDLSLEAYAYVFIALQQNLQLHRKFCTAENLRKVLLANNLSANKASKEFIIAHLHELPLFKPFFSSVGGLHDTNLLVSPIGIKHVDLIEDLSTLQWLEHGHVLMETNAQSLLGIPIENASSSAGHPLLKVPDCKNQCPIANPYPGSHTDGCKFTKKLSCDSNISNPNSRSVSGPASQSVITYKTDHDNLSDIVMQYKGLYEANPYVKHQLDQGISTPKGSHNTVVTLLSPPVDNACMYTTACVPTCNSQKKNLKKAAPELVASVGDLDASRYATQAHVVEGETDRNPWSSLVLVHSETTAASIEVSHWQPDVMNNICSLIVEDENACADGKLTFFQSSRLNEGQNTSSSTIPHLPSQDVTQDACKQLVSPHNFKRKVIENTLIDSSSQDIMAQLEESSLNRSTSNTATHDLVQPVFPVNLNREEVREVFACGNASQPVSQCSTRAVQELVPLTCAQPLHRKEGDITINRASQSMGMEMLDEAALHVSPRRPSYMNNIATANASPSDRLNKAALADPVQLNSSEISGYAAGQGRIFSYPPVHAQASSAAATEMEPNYTDAVSAGFLEVLSDSIASMPANRGALSACNEDSFNLLERWEKRRQESSELRGRMKPMMQEGKTKSGKIVHGQQGSEPHEAGEQGGR